MNRDAKLTIAACYFGSFTQAAVANLPPLFYVLYNEKLGLPLELIALFPTIFFGLQIIIDGLFSKLIDKIGYKLTATAADCMAVVGLVLLGLTPVFPSPAAIIVVSTVICAIGSGIIEITTSPLIEALPGDGKSAAMSLLHSFYCWGHLFVILASTLFFALFGHDKWYILPFIFSCIPATGAVLYLCIGKLRTLEEDGHSNKFADFGKNSLFAILFALMICAGAGEQVVSQWASFFAEKGLNISKAAGDLLGTSAFALCMASARTFFGVKGDKLNLSKSLLVCGVVLVLSYLLTALSPIPALSLAGVALCGLSVGIVWPCVLSLAGESGLNGGTLMFALLALGGDIGCTIGPAVSGEIIAKSGLHSGILIGAIFPVISVILLVVYRSLIKKKAQNKPLEKS